MTFAGVFICTCSQKISALSAFAIVFHDCVLSPNTCPVLSTYPAIPCLSSEVCPILGMPKEHHIHFPLVIKGILVPYKTPKICPVSGTNSAI